LSGKTTGWANADDVKQNEQTRIARTRRMMVSVGRPVLGKALC
jgi:hypothetical protein